MTPKLRLLKPVWLFKCDTRSVAVKHQYNTATCVVNYCEKTDWQNKSGPVHLPDKQYAAKWTIAQAIYLTGKVRRRERKDAFFANIFSLLRFNVFSQPIVQLIWILNLRQDLWRYDSFPVRQRLIDLRYKSDQGGKKGDHDLIMDLLPNIARLRMLSSSHCKSLLLNVMIQVSQFVSNSVTKSLNRSQSQFKSKSKSL